MLLIHQGSKILLWLGIMHVKIRFATDLPIHWHLFMKL